MSGRAGLRDARVAAAEAAFWRHGFAGRTVEAVGGWLAADPSRPDAARRVAYLAAADGGPGLRVTAAATFRRGSAEVSTFSVVDDAGDRVGSQTAG